MAVMTVNANRIILCNRIDPFFVRQLRRIKLLMVPVSIENPFPFPKRVSLFFYPGNKILPTLDLIQLNAGQRKSSI